MYVQIEDKIQTTERLEAFIDQIRVKYGYLENWDSVCVK